MMREIVVNGDVVDGAAHFQAALYVPELRQRLDALGDRHTGMAGGSERRKRVVAIVLAQQ